jgi:hypothetical protein
MRQQTEESDSVGVTEDLACRARACRHDIWGCRADGLGDGLEVEGAWKGSRLLRPLDGHALCLGVEVAE